MQKTMQHNLQIIISMPKVQTNKQHNNENKKKICLVKRIHIVYTTGDNTNKKTAKNFADESATAQETQMFEIKKT